MGASVRPTDDPALRLQYYKETGQHEEAAKYEQYLKETGQHPTPSLAPLPRMGSDATASRLGSRPTPTDPGGALAAGIRGAMQGATFGFADEAAAGVDALGDRLRGKGNTYDARLAENRARLDASRTAHPGAELVGELGGALAGGGVIGSGAKALGLGGRTAVAATRGARVLRLGEQAALGAAGGAVAGAGAAEGDLSDRGRGALKGAGYGAGAVLGLKAGGKVLNATGIPALVNSALPRAATSGSTGGKVLGALGRASNEELAYGDAAKLAERARLSLPELQAKVEAAHPDEMFLDVVGQPAVDRAGGAVATPSRGSNDIVTALDARDQRLPKSIKRDFGDAMGVTRGNTVKTVEQLAEERSTLADETFGALRTHYAAPKKIEALDGLVGRPSFDKAVGETEAILRESPGGLHSPLLTKQKINGKQVTVVRPLSFDEATLLKQTHDDVAKMATPMATLESGGVTKTRMGKQKGTHAELMDGLKTAFPGDEAAGVPSYEKALAGHADKSKLIDAHDLGQTFMNAKSDELAALWPSLSEPEREFYRKGALASVEDYVAGRTDGHNPVAKFRNDIMRDKLRIIMPTDDAADAIVGKVEKVHAMHGNRGQIVGNSKTASRLAQMSEAAGPSEGMAAITHVASGNPLGALGAITKSGLAQRARGLSEAQVNALAPILTASGVDLQAVIAHLQQVAAKRAGGGLGRAAAAGAAGGAVSAGPALRPRQP